MSEKTIGRPPVGPAVHVRLDPQLLAALDRWAQEKGVTRAEAVRRLLGKALA